MSDELTRGSTRQRVLLVKTDGTIGNLPIGEQYEHLCAMDVPRRDAKARAYRLLKRDHPDENPMCWTVQEPGPGEVECTSCGSSIPAWTDVDVWGAQECGACRGE